MSFKNYNLLFSNWEHEESNPFGWDRGTLEKSKINVLPSNFVSREIAFKLKKEETWGSKMRHKID